MVEPHNQRPYWRRTRSLMWLCMLGPAAGLLALPALIVALNRSSFMGFPLGYFVASHGFVILGFFVIVWFVQRQDAIDLWHGANEDI